MHFLSHINLQIVKLACLPLFYFFFVSEGLGQQKHTDTANEIQQSVEQNSNQRLQDLIRSICMFLLSQPF
jgi:hypothetical protein